MSEDKSDNMNGPDDPGEPEAPPPEDSQAPESPPAPEDQEAPPPQDESAAGGGAPDTGEPDGGAPDTGEPGGGAPDTGKPDGGAPDAGEPDGSAPDAGEPGQEGQPAEDSEVLGEDEWAEESWGDEETDSWDEDDTWGGDEEPSQGQDDQEPWRSEMEGEDQGFDDYGASEESSDQGAADGDAETTALATRADDDLEDFEADPREADLGPSMTLGEHLDDLRRRLIYALAGLAVAMLGAMAGGKWILALLQRPYVLVMKDHGLDPSLAVLKATSGFFTYFRVSLIAGIILSSPWIFYHLWMFIAAGLYKKERRYVKIAVPFSAILFVCGAMFFLFVVAKQMLNFFITFNVWMTVKSVVTLKDHVKFMTTLMLVFGLAFQTPLAVFILGKMGLVSLETFRKYRRHVIIGFLCLAAVATSPSPVDQIALAVPMWLLYELGMFLLWMSARKKKKEDDEFENDLAESAD